MTIFACLWNHCAHLCWCVSKANSFFCQIYCEFTAHSETFLSLTEAKCLKASLQNTIIVCKWIYVCLCRREQNPSAVMLMYYRETLVCTINFSRFVAHILPHPSLVEACTLLNGCGWEATNYTSSLGLLMKQHWQGHTVSNTADLHNCWSSCAHVIIIETGCCVLRVWAFMLCSWKSLSIQKTRKEFCLCSTDVD